MCFCLCASSCKCFNKENLFNCYIGVSGIISLIHFYDLIMINWGKLPSINLTLFIIILLMNFACLISLFPMPSLIHEEDNQEKKEKAKVFFKIGLILSIITVILCSLEIYFVSYGITQIKKYYPCYSKEEYIYHLNDEVITGFFYFKLKKKDTLISSLTITEIQEFDYYYKDDIEKKYNDYECHEILFGIIHFVYIYLVLIISDILHIFGVCVFNELRKFCDNSKKNPKENVQTNIVTFNNPSHKDNLSKNKSIKNESPKKETKRITTNINGVKETPTINFQGEEIDVNITINNENHITINNNKEEKNKFNKKKCENHSENNVKQNFTRILPFKNDGGNNNIPKKANKQTKFEDKKTINLNNLPIDSGIDSIDTLTIDIKK